MGKWLANILKPVLEIYTGFCIPDSFRFAEFIRDVKSSSNTGYLCFYDISSLFINVPLDENIGICADSLYRRSLTKPSFPEHIFLELMGLATKSVEFSFDKNMYRQVDGVAMGSPLGPTLANNFVSFQEKLLFDRFPEPMCYSVTWMTFFLCVLPVRKLRGC